MWQEKRCTAEQYQQFFSNGQQLQPLQPIYPPLTTIKGVHAGEKMDRVHSGDV
jgi:hypothetical protein